MTTASPSPENLTLAEGFYETLGFRGILSAMIRSRVLGFATEATSAK
jgi:hypothetical protein